MKSILKALINLHEVDELKSRARIVLAEPVIVSKVTSPTFLFEGPKALKKWAGIVLGLEPHFVRESCPITSSNKGKNDEHLATKPQTPDDQIHQTSPSMVVRNQEVSYGADHSSRPALDFNGPVESPSSCVPSPMSDEEMQRHLGRDWFKRHGFISQDRDEFKSTVTFQDVARAAFKDGLAHRQSPLTSPHDIEREVNINIAASRAYHDLFGNYPTDEKELERFTDRMCMWVEGAKWALDQDTGPATSLSSLRTEPEIPPPAKRVEMQAIITEVRKGEPRKFDLDDDDAGYVIAAQEERIQELEAESAKLKAVLENTRQEQASCVLDLKALKHSGFIQDRVYDVIQNQIERIFHSQRSIMDALEAKGEGK